MIEILTPKGHAGDLYLCTPDTRFNLEGTYKAPITLNAAAGEQLKSLLEREAVKELGPKLATKVKMPGTSNDDGTVTFRFGSTSKPNVYDSAAKLIEPGLVKASRIGNGSTIRIIGGAKAWEHLGKCGVALYLYEVQVVHLVKGGGNAFEADFEGTFFA